VTQTSNTARPDQLAGWLLGYTSVRDLSAAGMLTGTHPRSGLVVRGRGCVEEVARHRNAGWTQLLGIDPGFWSHEQATPDRPMGLPSRDGLFEITLDAWAANTVAQGADVVLTPSLFVAEADWDSLRAVLRSGQATDRDEVRTLVPTDASMLERAHLPRLVELLFELSGRWPLAFAFAGRREPLARLDRAAGLRTLLARHPGSLVIAVDVLAGTDVVAHGGGGAIGVVSSLRRPTRPGDPGGPPANGFVPGLFLRDLWETRSPSTYTDWFANSPSPTCPDCGGRAMDNFTDHPLDKQQILRHNLHAWLSVLTQITRRHPAARRDWLNTERRRAFAAHLELRPIRATMNADKLLRALCELDDPQQRRTTPTGSWR